MTHLHFCVSIVFLASFLAACMPQQGGPESPTAPKECAGAAFADLVGQPADAAIAVPQPKRVITPNSAVTTDYNPARSNVMLNKKGLISKITCG